ncbi:MAG: hypothetical protein AAF589_02255 [Planctomycetota bacterium]
MNRPFVLHPAAFLFALVVATTAEAGDFVPQAMAPPMIARTAPYAGHVNHAHYGQSFRWGWFGAEHFYPTIKSHRGYYGDHYRWSRHRRY